MKTILHDAQLEVARDTHRYRIVCAGRRFGKSILADLVILKWGLNDIGLYWIVSPTYKQSKQIHWRQLQQIIPQDWILKKNEVELSITLRNGAIIELKGAENPDALRGVKLKGLVIDEIASIHNWSWLWAEVLRPTLTDYQSPVLFISTPKGYNHFFDLYQKGLQGGEYKSWKFTSYDNPYIKKEEIDAAKKDLTIDQFSQEYMAEFTRFRGLIYREFNPDEHVRYFDHTFNEHADYYTGIDFAVRGFTASLAVKIKEDGVMYILDEYKEEENTAKRHSEAIKTMLKLYADFDKYQVCYGDPAGFAKNQQKGDMLWSLADEYLEDGFPLVKANNEVVAGINFVRQMFANNKIIIHPRCNKLVQELQDYQWKEQPTSRIGSYEEPEEVRKINDHLCDVLRYTAYSKPDAAAVEEHKSPFVFPAVFPLKLDVEDEDEDKFTPLDSADPYE
jgi:phage terminase large subunit